MINYRTLKPGKNIVYLPIYFQACKGFSPLKSGTVLLPLAFSTAPASIVAGISVSKTGRYRPQLWAGWALAIPALVLIGLAGVQTPMGNIIGYEFLAGIGFGLVFSATYFPVLAPLPLTTIAPALAFFAFLRQFGQVSARRLPYTFYLHSFGLCNTNLLI